jgi:hypothetical protein
MGAGSNEGWGVREFYFLVIVGVGIIGAAIAKRYNRNQFGWAFLAAFVWPIALPLLFLLGPRETQPAVVSRSRSDGPHLPAALPTTSQGLAVLDVLAVSGHADFDTIATRTGLSEDEVADTLDALLDRKQVDGTTSGYRMTERTRKAHTARARPTPQARSTGQESPPAPDHAARLRSLASLHADGFLTDAEYEEKRQGVIEDL